MIKVVVCSASDDDARTEDILTVKVVLWNIRIFPRLLELHNKPCQTYNTTTTHHSQPSIKVHTQKHNTSASNGEENVRKMSRPGFEPGTSRVVTPVSVRRT